MDELFTQPDTRRDKSAKTSSIFGRGTVPLFEWLVFLAFAVLLSSYFLEVCTNLGSTSRFQRLELIFGILFPPIAATLILRLLQRDPSAPKSPLRRGRGITGLLILNLATAALAITTAKAINPNYDFQTPLLRFSERLLRQFLT